MERVLSRLRRISLALPEAEETTSFGHPTWKVKNKTFVVLEEYKGEPAIVFKATMADQALLTMDPQFYIAPYTGKHGWTSMRAGSSFDWDAVEDLVGESYRLVVPKRLAATTEAASKHTRHK